MFGSDRRAMRQQIERLNAELARVGGELETLKQRCKPSPKRWEGRRWAMSGDSIVAQGLWQPTVSAYLRTAAFENWGVPMSLMNHVVMFRQAPDFDGIDLYGVSSGTNDFTNQTPLGSPGDSSAAATFWAATRRTIETILGWKPSLRMFMMTPLHRSNELLPERSIPLEAYVDAILACCAIYGIPVYDQWRRSGIGPATFALYLDHDGISHLHPTIAGAELVGQQMARWLEAL